MRRETFSFLKNYIMKSSSDQNDVKAIDGVAVDFYESPSGSAGWIHISVMVSRVASF
jgi:hypothetical protein